MLLAVDAGAATFDTPTFSADVNVTRLAGTISQLQGCPIAVIHQKLAALVSIFNVKAPVSASVQFDQAAGAAYYRFWDGAKASRIDLNCTTTFKED
jgi:hypothetical protein